MSVVLGGTPSSKLFMNVREKQSLCYYCAARHDTPKNVMFVQSGVETKDLDRTEEAILKELNDMKKGNITDDEILFAKLAMCNSYNAVADSAASMETWYLSGMLPGQAPHAGGICGVYHEHHEGRDCQRRRACHARYGL